MLSIENKRMKLNILRHKQKLLELLENIDDTTIKPRIKFDPSEIDELLSSDVKPEPEKIDVKITKKESEEEVVDSTDDFISVGSSDGWNNASLPLTVTEIDIRRKSSRLEAASHFTYPPSLTQEDHMYALDHIEEKSRNQNNNRSRSRSKRKSRRPSVDLDESPPPKHRSSNNQSRSRSKRKSRRPSYDFDESPPPPPRTSLSRYRGDFDRDRHNAKERECRQQIAEMFIELRNACSKMETNRRIPSKQFILSTAKNECIALNNCQKKLIAQKKKLISENAILKKKCNMLKMNRIIF